MRFLDELIGVWSVTAAVAVVAVASGLSVARERRGPEARTVTVADSHPWLTSLTILVVAAGVGLFILRLGVLS